MALGDETEPTEREGGDGEPNSAAAAPSLEPTPSDQDVFIETVDGMVKQRPSASSAGDPGESNAEKPEEGVRTFPFPPPPPPPFLPSLSLFPILSPCGPRYVHWDGGWDGQVETQRFVYG